ncbi:Ig-like domain-containing protein [uncultured Polaribacter sp.]|uniref:Ig-like domain-containing protein n=1 Tax=uncultured Polaribacter sp. TaxID=174711 RepID=UPI00260CE235|nr:Ig-like domain-containing protein [uncultured Polaribacter sp.]
MKKQKIILLLMLIAFSITAKAQLEGKHSRSVDFRGTWGVRILLPTAYDIAFPDGSGINAENFDVDLFMQQINQLTTITHVNINIHRGHQASWYSSPYPEMEAIMGSDLFPKRDFFGEVLDALKQRGLKVMVYFSRTGMDSQYLTAAQMNTWNTYLSSEGFTHYEGVAKILEYYAVKFGNKIDGWWVDRASVMTTDEHELFVSAIRTGNPDAMIAFHVKTGMPIRQGTKFCDYTAGHPVAVNTQPTWTLSNVGMVENIEAGPWIDLNGNPDPSEGTALGSILMPFQRKWRDGAADFPTAQAIEWTTRAMAGGGMYSWAVAREGNGFASPQFNQLLDIDATVAAYLNNTNNVSNVSVTPDEVDLSLNNTIQLTANVTPYHALNKAVNWTSDNNLIATVSASGLVTPIAEGIVTITATTDDGGFTDNSIVNVVPELGENLALNGTATQSTTLNNRGPELAIDNNTDGVYNRGSVTVAEGTLESKAWWEVDLGDEYNINIINIFNRIDNCCIQRLSDFTLFVYDSNGNQTYSQTITTTPNPDVTINASAAVGQVIRIESNLTDTNLNLAEVQVFGDVILGIEDNSKADKLLVYPNPTSDSINIDFRNSEEASYSIVNYTGQILLSGVVKNGTTSIDVSGLSSGFYLIRISNEYKTVSRKIIKN